MQIIVAAKRVDVIDGYAESLNIDKFDLAIDWGFLYFITKPLFYGIDYFFKLLEIMVLQLLQLHLYSTSILSTCKLFI
jgi:membrane protein insertase Oxa1/YidC/SpoIIIJ